MENKYLKTKMYQMIFLLLLIGSLNWGTTALGYNFVEIIKNLLNNSLKMETYIDKIIYFLVALAGITLVMNRDLWSPCIENFSSALIIPSAPVLLIATPGVGAGSVNLYWSASANATSYKIKARDQLNNTELYRTIDTNNLSYTFTGLTNGRPYDFSVVGQNSDGESPSSNTLSTIPNINISPIVRSAPLNLRASILNNTATIIWAKPIRSSGIIGYIIYREVTLNNQIIPSQSIIVLGENTLSAQMGILPEYIYTIRVSALYSRGPLTGGPASFRITLPPAIPYTAPLTLPTISAMLVNGNPSISWTPISGVSYSVNVYTGNTPTGTPTRTIDNLTSSPIVVTGLPAGTYSFTVTATRGSETITSTNSATAIVLEPLTLPTVSAMLVNGNPSISWTPISGVSYSVNVYTGNTPTGTPTRTIDNLTSSPIVVTGLPAGTYSFTVTATRGSETITSTNSATAIVLAPIMSIVEGADNNIRVYIKFYSTTGARISIDTPTFYLIRRNNTRVQPTTNILIPWNATDLPIRAGEGTLYLGGSSEVSRNIVITLVDGNGASTSVSHYVNPANVE